MDVRFGRILVLLAVVCTASTARAGSLERGGPALTAPTTSRTATAADKAAEARRLADQAAVLAQRAAALAAESQAAQPAATAPKKVGIVTQSTPWSTRGAAEVLISDSDPQPESAAVPSAEPSPVPSPVPSIGWRSHRTAPGSAIHFADPSVPASTAATAAKSTPVAATSNQPGDAKPGSFELKLTQAAQLYADEAPADSVKPTPAAATTAAVAPPAQAAENTTSPATNPAVEPQALPESIRLAATIADAKVKTADSEEPMPTPAAPQYTDDKMMQSDGVPYDCVDGCCPQPRPLFWTSGIEATFLRPDLNDGAADFSVVEYGNNRFDEFSTSTNDVDDFYMAPRIWLGVQGCKWGANLRYFHLRASEGAFDPVLGSDGEWDGPQCGVPDFGFDSCNDLEAYTIDLEVTRRVCLYDCWMQFSAGVRHAEIEHNAVLNAEALADDSVLFSYADAHRASRGTGIVLGWYGRKPIFPCSCVHWFYNFRWSAVWGPTETAADTGVLVSLTSADPLAVAAAGSVNGASTRSNGDMFIGEIQLGLEWDYALRCIPANAFCRVAAEYQRWDGGTGYSASNSFAGVEINSVPTTLGNALAVADTPELDLVGLTIGAGLTW